MPDSNVHFRSALRGYDRAQVDQHINRQAQASAAVWQEATQRTLRSAHSRLPIPGSRARSNITANVPLRSRQHRWRQWPPPTRVLARTSSQS